MGFDTNEISNAFNTIYEIVNAIAGLLPPAVWAILGTALVVIITVTIYKLIPFN